MRGWYIDKAKTQLFDFSQPVTENITLYADYYKASCILSTPIPETSTDVTLNINGSFNSYSYIYFTVPYDCNVTFSISSYLCGNTINRYKNSEVSGYIYRAENDESLGHFRLFNIESLGLKRENITLSLMRGEVYYIKVGNTFSASKYEYATEATLRALVSGIEMPYGSISCTSGLYEKNESITLTAQSKPGYVFCGWYEGNTKVFNEFIYTFNMPSVDLNYTAKWITNPVIIENTLPEGGIIYGMPSSPILGEEITLTARPNIGYRFLGWYIGDTQLTDSVEYTFELTDANIVFIAMFESDHTALSNFEYELNADGETYTITGIKDRTVTEIAVPNYVSCIQKGAFTGCTNLNSITLPFVGASDTGTNNTYLGYIFGADSYLNNPDYVPSSLKTVIITEIINIDYGAFYGCNGLVNISFSDNATNIGDYAFYGCNSLTSVTIPNCVTNIGNYAFYNCNKLKNIDLPNGLTSIGNYVFFGCSGFTSIHIPNGITSIGDYTFCGCSNLTRITIPDSVKSIGDSAFSNCHNLANISIPNSVDSIGSFAFNNCRNLTDITIPDGITSISIYMFSGCSNLTKINIPDSVKSIGDSAFSGCNNLSDISITNSVDSIGQFAFSNCTSLTSITLKGNASNGSTTTIGANAFENCVSLTIYCSCYSKPNGWNSDWNISSCPVVWDCRSNDKDANGYAYVVIDGVRYSLRYRNASVIRQPSNIAIAEIPSSITYNNVIYSITTIEQNAFKDCKKLTDISIPNSITNISEAAFSGCSSLASISIPNSITSIGKSAFFGCWNLTSLTISKNITTIGDFAFASCSNITSIYYSGTIDDWANIDIGSSNSPLDSAKIYYYSETNPFEGENAVDSGNYWHYDTDGETPKIWLKN